MQPADMAGSALAHGKAFLSGQRLAPAARPSRAQPAAIPMQAAAAATKKLKAGASKKRPPPRKVPNTQKGTQRIGGGTQIFGKGGTVRIGSQPAKKV